MKLTREEKQKLQQNVLKIVGYINENICPNLHGSSITIDFGPMETYFAPTHMEKKYHITVSKEGVSGRTGNLGLSVVPDNERTFHCMTFWNYEDAGMALLREWPSIKDELLKHVRRVAGDAQLLDTFQI